MTPRMRTAYFDCFRGAGGDMIVGSLVDAGADPTPLRAALAGLELGGHTLSIEKVTKQGFAATRFHVALDAVGAQPHRHLKHVVEIIKRARVSEEVRRRAINVFTRLAEAEARVHGTSVEKVHFHEVGAVDAILDVLGALLALELLGVDRVICSPIPVGSGTVTCSHGIMPVPAPATAELLRGVPLAGCDEAGELTTPTAAAILTTLAESYGPMPAMTVQAIGYGAGTRDGQNRPNVLRVLIGESAETEPANADQVMLLETNLDDATPQVVAHAVEQLLKAGALDVWSVPIVMKKGRCGLTLAVLCRIADLDVMEGILFGETPTFGVRRQILDRTTLRRRHETVDTPFGPIRMKIGERATTVTATPEYEDCRVAAESRGIGLRQVIAAAEAAWRDATTKDG